MMNTAVATTTSSKTDSEQEMSAMQILMDDVVMRRIEAFADRMATSKVTVPKHLQGSPGDCMAITMQAMTWGMNPYAVAQKTHIVSGTLGYEAQLVNAVITARAPVKERLKYEWYGDWKGVNGKTDKSWERGVIITATFIGESAPRDINISMAQVGDVRNSPLWVADPKQQIAYLATKRWARLHCPDVILGVYTPDEIIEREEYDVTPVQPTVKKHQGTSGLKQQMQARDAKNAESVIEHEDQQATEASNEPPFDVDGFLTILGAVDNLNDLQKLGDGLPKNLSSEDKGKIANIYKPASKYFKLVDAMNAVESADDLDALMANDFEPNSNIFSDEQATKINALYEERMASLTA